MFDHRDGRELGLLDWLGEEESGDAEPSEDPDAPIASGDEPPPPPPADPAETIAAFAHYAHDAEANVVADDGPGEPVADDIAGWASGHLGLDTTDVRVHGGEGVRADVGALGARALAAGEDIFLGPGESATDPEVMAHELTHVAQAPDDEDVARPLAVTSGSSPAEREADAMADRAKSGAAPSQLIADSAESLQPGQMTREAFLAELRQRATDAANAALAPEQSADDCPYIEQWFARHAETDAAGIERMARRYSRLPGAERAADYIEQICSRVTQGIRAWKSGGDISSELDAAGVAMDAESLPPPPGSAAEAIEAMGPAERLEGGTAALMSDAIGADVAAVEIHRGAEAERATSAAGARAMAVGDHIAFGAGAFAPGTLEGDAILAHELAHATFHREAAADRRALAAPLGAEDESEETAADEVAGGALASLWASIKGGARRLFGRAAGVARSGLSLQRCKAGTAPKYGFSAHREGPDVGRKVGVLGGWSKSLQTTGTLGEAETEVEAITMAKVFNRPAAIIAGQGVFFVYAITTPRDLSPEYVEGAGLSVDDAAVAIVSGSNVYRPGETTSAATADARELDGDVFAPFRELEGGDFDETSEPEFIAVFEAAMRDNALSILASSERQARQKQKQLGGGVEAVSAGERETIDEAAKEALAVEKEIESRVDAAGGPRTDGAGAGSKDPRPTAEIEALRARRARINLRYPMLGRYRTAQSLERFVALDEKQRVASLASDAGTVLSNIKETRENVLSGALNLWLIPGVVDSTTAGLAISKDSPQREWIHSKAQAQAKRDRVHSIAMAAFSIGLGLAAAVATGGLSLTLTAGVVGVGVYDAVETTEDYSVRQAGTDTDIDAVPGESMLPEEMRSSWGWVVAAWVGLGLDAYDVVKVVKGLGKAATVEEAARALAKGDAALLEKLRRAAGDLDIGEAISETNRAKVGQLLGAEVAIDPRQGRGVSVDFTLDAKGRPVVTGVTAGARASVGDIIGHRETIQLLERHNSLAQRVSDLWTRLKSFGKKGAKNPFPPGSEGFNSWLEVKKLEGLIRVKRARITELLGKADTGALQTELHTQIKFIESNLATHRRVVDDLGGIAGSRRAVEMNDDTRAALEAGYRLPGLEGKDAKSITEAELKGSRYHFTRTETGFTIEAKPDRVAKPTSAGRGAIEKYGDSLEKLLSRKDLPHALRNDVAAEVNRAMIDSRVDDTAVRKVIQAMRRSEHPHNVHESLAELRHMNNVANSGELAKGSKVHGSVEPTNADGSLRKTDLGDGVEVDVDPVPDADALYRTADGKVHLDEVKRTPTALANKLRDKPDQLDKLVKWQRKEPNRMVLVVVESEEKWTNLLGMPDVIEELASKGISLKIAGRELDPGTLGAFHAKIHAKYKKLVKPKGELSPRQFFELPEMASIDSAAAFVGLSL